ncbi:MAG: hypothetical protein ACXAC2_18925 [Candidatus Kariarchaeaceae archaeon]
MENRVIIIYSIILMLVPVGLASNNEIKINALNLRETDITVEWENKIEGKAHPFSAIQTSEGGYAIAAADSEQGPGEIDFWLIKTAANGQIEWNRTIGGEERDVPYSLVQTSDDGYAIAGDTGSFGEGGVWLVKTDASGQSQWNKTYGGEGAVANSVIQTPDGGYALACQNTHHNAGNSDFWLIKTDINGQAIWNRTFGGSDDEVANSLVHTSDGGYAIAGWSEYYGPGTSVFWLVKTDIDGSTEWEEKYVLVGHEVANSMIQTSDGGFALAGYTSSYVGGEEDMWLIKTDANGQHQWNKTYGGEWAVAKSMIQTSDGGYAFFGETESYGAGESDIWLIKTDANGETEWNATFGGSENEGFGSAIQTSDGGFMVAGTYGGENSEGLLFFKIGSIESIEARDSDNGFLQLNPIFLVGPLFIIAIKIRALNRTIRKFENQYIDRSIN